MATLINDRNVLLYSASSRVTGASVSITPGTATSLVIPKSNTIIIPSAITLTANTQGYVTPSYTWSYRFGDSGTFTAITATTNPISITCDAAYLTALGTNNLVQYKVAITETTSNLGINQSEYTLSIPIVREGADGTSGINSMMVTIYKRTTTNAAPTIVTTGNSTYTFTSGLLVGQPSGWTQSIPSSVSGAYLWSTQILAAAVTPSYAFANSLWPTAILYAQDGTQGTNGTNTALIYAYKRAAVAPIDNPGTVDYSFSSNTITTVTLANSWAKIIPAGTDPLYVVLATAASTTATDSVLSTEWTAPVLLVQNGTDGAPGSPGTDGINSATIYLYARNNNSTIAPTLATTGSVTYTFASGGLTGTLPTGWTQSIPDLINGSILWVVQATAAASTATDIINNTEWSNARALVQNGANGLPGNNGTRGSRQLYSNSTSYTSTYVYSGNAAGAASYAVAATTLIASAVVGTVPTTPIRGDTVTFTNGTTYVYTITYNPDTTAWEPPGTVIDGSLLVTGSVTAAKINSTGLAIRNAAGKVILGVGVDLEVLAPTDIAAAYPAVVNNASISIASNGTLSGAGGGAVTINGLGYTGALDATSGNILNFDQTCGNPAIWSSTYIATITGGVTSNTAIVGSNGAHLAEARTFPYDTTRRYKVSALIRKTAAVTSGTVYLGILNYDAAGNGQYGWGGYTYWGMPATSLSTSFSRYSAEIAANSQNAGTVRAAVHIILGHPNTGGGRVEFQDIKVEDITDAYNAASTASTAQGTANNAASAASTAQTAANDRISKSAASTLSATVSVDATTGAGFRAGNLTWNAAGNRIAGSGVAMTPGGLVGYDAAGNNTFAINASTGAAIFKGTLDVKSASSGARMEIKNNVIKVFDANGVLRIQLGDLSV